MLYSISKISLFLASVVSALDTVVDLQYASYQGYANSTNGVTQWLGIRYAAPPVGNLRFAAPEDPLNMSGIQDATKVSYDLIGWL